MTEFYRVAEFAKLAGVTIRALQYYDRIGLLAPSGSTEGGHRLYQRRDLLRLQQILTLKWIGFKLDQIKELLESPEYDLRTALRFQKAAIDSQIGQLQVASQALEQALTLKNLEAGMLNSQAVNSVIRAVTTPEEMPKHYSDEAWAGIVTRGMSYSQADFARFTEDWQKLYEQFEELQHLPPDSAPVQELAATMFGYLEAFTAGDKETEEGLRRTWEAGDVPEEAKKMSDSALQSYMNEAVAIYRKRKGL
jgi:MerR family transcriptional regulator, thiopeptide resistance regulator